jgi:hypothetical protein
VPWAYGSLAVASDLHPRAGILADTCELVESVSVT